MERERYQLVVSLGEGADGQRLREVVDRAAERAGKPVTAWARETLLTAAGDSTNSIDPIAEVRVLQTQMTTIDLRQVAAMQTGWSHQVRALVAGEWTELGTPDPDALFERWKRVCRAR